MFGRASALAGDHGRGGEPAGTGGTKRRGCLCGCRRGVAEEGVKGGSEERQGQATLVLAGPQEGSPIPPVAVAVPAGQERPRQELQPQQEQKPGAPGRPRLPQIEVEIEVKVPIPFSAPAFGSRGQEPKQEPQLAAPGTEREWKESRRGGN